MKSHPKVQFRYIVDQQNGYGGEDEITFDGSFTWPLQEQGRTDAINALNDTNQKNVLRYYKEWIANESQLSKKYKGVTDYVRARVAQDRQEDYLQ